MLGVGVVEADQGIEEGVDQLEDGAEEGQAVGGEIGGIADCGLRIADWIGEAD